MEGDPRPSSTSISVCNGCNLSTWTFFQLLNSSFESDGKPLFDFLINHGVLKREHNCIKCGGACKLFFASRSFKCSKISVLKKKKKRECCNYKVTLFYGSYFNNCRVDFHKMCHFVYLYLYLPVRGRSTTITEDLKISTSTYTDWASCAREVIVDFMVRNSHAIGGPGVIVDIDEAKVGCCKYIRKGSFQGQWVIGGVERDNRSRQFFVAVDQLNVETFIDVLKKYVLPGTMILGDCWKAYNDVSSEDIQQFTMTHNVKFFSPNNGAHTLGIEWRNLSAKLPQAGRRKEYFMEYLAEAHFRSMFTKPGERFHHFWKAVGVLYPPMERTC